MRRKTRRRLKRERVEHILKEYESVFSILGLEKQLSFPKGTIHKFLRYGRSISDERIDIIDQFFHEFIIAYEKD